MRLVVPRKRDCSVLELKCHCDYGMEWILITLAGLKALTIIGDTCFSRYTTGIIFPVAKL